MQVHNLGDDDGDDDDDDDDGDGDGDGGDDDDLMNVLIILLLRIMDCFLSEGIETIFRIALTLLMIAKHELLLLDMEGVIKYFQVG